MTKRPSEAEFGAALREVDLVSYVFRPPDPKTGAGVSNWKPCDFMAWHRGSIGDLTLRALTLSTWFECKDTTAISAFPFADLRPSQLAGIRDAARLGIPYWLAVYWRRQKEWTISDAVRVLAWRAIEQRQLVEAHFPVHNQPGSVTNELIVQWEAEAEKAVTSIPRGLLESRFGVSCSRAQLTSTLKQVLLGEAS